MRDDYLIKKVWIDPRVKDHPLVNKILGRVKEAQVAFTSLKGSSGKGLSFEEGKETLYLTEFPGNFIKSCPGTGKGYLCCGYTIINQPINCPQDCTYCILQEYLGNSPLIFYVNFDRLINQLDNFLKRYQGRILRIGNGELSDSLALDYVSDFSSFLISYFRRKKNVILEFKTKTDQVQRILTLTPAKNIVVSWSLNPQHIIEKEENFTASLEKRLTSAYLVQERGFRLGFHFDPLIFYPGWETDYDRLIESLFSLIDPSRIFWISLGALRFPPHLKEIIQNRFPQTKIIYEEMIEGLDGKLRYIKPLRIKIFRRVYEAIKDRAPRVFCYFCMESPDVWERVMGFFPRSSSHFQYLFEQHCKKVLEG